MSGNNLVIVESPAKAKTIHKYLGKNFKVMASVGHVKDLPKTRFGVDVENDFQPSYRVIKGKEKVVNEIRAAAGRSKAVYLAPDPDREGEAIAWHIANELNLPPERVFRVTFNEITRAAVTRAFEHPGKLDQNLVDAQQARRILDRIVGYSLSPFLGDKVKKGLSAGRVQSVALRLICEREEEIRSFTSREYWTVGARLRKGELPEFTARLDKVAGKKAEIGNGGEASALLERLREAEFAVEKVSSAERRRNPAAPFITSQLQQEAFRRLGFSAKRTMALAQRLYEGVELPGEGQVALITYMRTDSPRVAAEAQVEARGFIAREYGEAYLPEKPNVYSPKKKGKVQDAHECIRPTSVERRPDAVRASLERDLARLYDLIWSRFVASQMTPARLEEVTAEIAAADCLFKARGSRMLFDGHLRAFADQAAKDRDEEDGNGQNGGEEPAETMLPPLDAGDRLALLELLPKQNFTQPPPRYSEASLIKALEEKGIGRPSTYAAILSTIQAREYTEKVERKLRPTELGELVNRLLVAHFPDIFNVDFTARMEEELDLIEEGQRGWVETLREFYAPFQQDLDKASREVPKVIEETGIACEKCGRPMVIRWGKKGRFMACSGYPECRNARDLNGENGESRAEPEATDQLCEKCGKPMVIRQGRRGSFLSCSGYPKCRNAKNFERTPEGGVRVVEPEVSSEACPKCGKPMAVKVGKFGRFLACTGYPKCRTTRPIPGEEVSFPCAAPGCDGRLTLRPSRRGRFWGCSRYPDCRFAIWGQPEEVPCPVCGSPVTVHKKGEDATLVCPRKGCGHEFAAPTEAAAK